MSVKIRLQGHEKFMLREGWLTKGLLLVSNNAKVFLSTTAPDEFGVGSNMVKSIRYWLKAFCLVEEKVNKGASLTSYGELVLRYDPYIEDNYTLWLLHSNIARNLEEATSWHLFFNHCDAEGVSKEQIEQILKKEIYHVAGNVTFSENSLKNDIDVMINMYCSKEANKDPEEKAVSPFSRLGLLKNNGGYYTKQQPDRRTINEWTVLRELARMMNDHNSISIDEVIYGECGLMNLYNLQSIIANEMLDTISAMGYITIDRTAGLDMIYKVHSFDEQNVIEDYYKNR